MNTENVIKQDCIFPISSIFMAHFNWNECFTTSGIAIALYIEGYNGVLKT